jgi:phenylacetate-CoA ligase
MKVKKVRLSPIQVYSRLRFYKKSQYWNRAAIEQYQLECTRNILLHAGANVPYYRDLFKSIRFDPDKFKSLKDLLLIPLLDKERVRQNPERFIADHTQTMHGHWKKTSGSTGKPLKIFLDRTCHINKYAATLRAYHWAGYSPGKLAFLLVEPDGLNKEFGYRLFSNSLYFDSRTVNRENVLKFYRLLKRFNPGYYIGYGKAFLHFYRHLVELNLPVPSPQSIIHYGENLQKNDRQKLEEYYSTKVFDFYSHREDVVMAADTEPGKKYLMDDFFYPEILNEKNQIVEEGTGELIGTGFYNYAMPLIRYRTDDIFKVKKYSKGDTHNFTYVEDIQGRVNDKVITPSGREYYFLGDPLFNVPGIISVQYIQDHRDSLRINLLTEDDFNLELVDQLKKKYLEYIGEPMTFDVQLVDKFEERGRGKRPVIISRLNESIN